MKWKEWKEKVLDDMATIIGTAIIFIPLYIVTLGIASQYPSHYWEMIIGGVFFFLIIEINIQSNQTQRSTK